jgi:hypothetical protein
MGGLETGLLPRALAAALQALLKELKWKLDPLMLLKKKKAVQPPVLIGTITVIP